MSRNSHRRKQPPTTPSLNPFRTSGREKGLGFSIVNNVLKSNSRQAKNPHVGWNANMMHNNKKQLFPQIIFSKPKTNNPAPIKKQVQWQNLSTAQKIQARFFNRDSDGDGVPDRWDCLDSETEILTINGWKKRGEINVGDMIYAYDLADKSIKQCRALAVGERNLYENEKMLEILNHRFNIRVTENHRMFVIKNRRGKFIEVKAKELSHWKSDFQLPISGLFNFKGIDLSDDEIRLIAWHITDGCINKKRGCFIIYQAEHKEIDSIENLIKRLGYKYYKYKLSEKRNTNGFKQTSPLWSFRIEKTQLLKLGKYFDKEVSPLLMEMNREQFIVFYKELLLGDGSGLNLVTGKKELAERLNQMAILRGIGSTFAIVDREGFNRSYRVSFFNRQIVLTSPSTKKIKQSSKLKMIEPLENERVWCVTNELGTLITRRHGKVVILGNCQPHNYFKQDSQIYLSARNQKIPKKFQPERKQIIKDISEGEKTYAFVQTAIHPKKTFLGYEYKNMDFNRPENIRHLSTTLAHEEIHHELQKIKEPEEHSMDISNASHKFDNIVIRTAINKKDKTIMNPYSEGQIEPSFKRRIPQHITPANKYKIVKPLYEEYEKKYREQEEGAPVAKQQEWKQMPEEQKENMRELLPDKDGDKVPDCYDCSPENPKEDMAKYYHGTVNVFTIPMRKEGIKPAKQLPPHYKMSDKTQDEYTYAFKEPHHAHTWAKVVTQHVGMGKPQVIEVDVPPETMEREYEMPFGESYKHKGAIRPEQITDYDYKETDYPEEKEVEKND